MKLIKKIEIKYFRSIHSTKVIDCKNLNIFSGRNDVGKSNVIKALNLFFNGITDYDSGFDFYENFSNKRLSEVRSESIKGKQFISISIEFIRPKSYKNSLPEFFTVERKWHRESKTHDQKDNLAALEKQKKLPNTLSSAQSNLTKFLNKIVFEYVPAIKDRNYFKNLLVKLQENLLHNSVSDDEGLTGSASSLASSISDQIYDLKSDFERATSVDTNIRPPSSISALFQSFIISTTTSHGDIPLRFRGDGLQARYIASALHYYASKKSAFFIWGFEEPEIALEYTHASKLASDFEQRYSRNIQIFVTSHSPAFISLTSGAAARYRVISDNNESKVVNIDAESDTDHFEKLQEELGIIEIHKEVHKKYSEKISELEYIKEQMVLLKSDAANEKRPIVLTEGKTDKSILDTAYEKIFSKKPNYIIRPCDNISKHHVTNGGCPNLSKMIESIHFEDKKTYIAIFDHDKEGLDCFKKLRNFDQDPNNHRLKVHKNGFAFALLLPVPEFRQNTPDCVCIEFLFEDTCFKDSNGKGLLTELDISLVSNGVKIDLPLSAIQLDLLPVSPVPKITGGKNDFAERVVKTLDAHCFEGFKVLFSDIDSIVSQVHSSDN